MPQLPATEEVLESEIRNRAGQHSRSASYDTFVIVVTLVACVFIFAAADEISSLFRKEAPHEKALAEAEAKVYVSLASLADPLAEFIRKLPPRIEPALDRIISEYLSEDNKQTSEVVTPDPNEILKDTLRELDEQILLGQAPRVPGVAPSAKDQQTAAGEVANIRHELFAARQLDVAQQLIHQSKILASQDELLSRYERNASRDAQIEIAQIRAAAEREIADRRSSVDLEIAEVKAHSEVEVVEAKADSEVEVAREAAELAREETKRAQEMNELISNALTRFGSVVMVIWLVRIFVAKRNRSVELAGFYLAVADTMAIMRHRDIPFGELMQHLMPPRAREGGKADAPPDGLFMKLLEQIRP